MPDKPPLPPIRLLRAFEAAAHHGNFSGAATELHTTQSAVSRAMAELERQLGRQLFVRMHRGVELTVAGELYREGVAAGLARIRDTGAALSMDQDGSARNVVIACGHATADMFLMPLHQDLCRAIGPGDIRLLVCDYALLDRLRPHEADIVLTYSPGKAEQGDRALAHGNLVAPVCSPEYAEAHAETLRSPVEAWEPLTFLYLDRPSPGWATWMDWFEVAGRPSRRPNRKGYSNYSLLFRDVLDGKGVALGWRDYIQDPVGRGELVVLGGGFTGVGSGQWAVLTERGRTRPCARRCLEFFAELSRRRHPDAHV